MELGKVFYMKVVEEKRYTTLQKESQRKNEPILRKLMEQ